MEKQQEQFESYVQGALPEDVNRLEEELPRQNRGALRKVWDQVQLLWKLATDPSVAWRAKAVAVGALLYVVSPLDAIPDIIPILGLTDDAAVVAAAVALLGAELHKRARAKA